MNREKIKKELNLDKIYFEAFFKICPFTLNSLRIKDRKEPLIYYRQLGCFWIWLSGVTLEKTGKYFKRDHSLISSSLAIVYNQIHTTYREGILKLTEENQKLLEQNNLDFYEIFSKDIKENQESILSKVATIEKIVKSCLTDIENIKKEL